MTDNDEANWFRQVFAASPDPAWLIEDGRFIDCNPAAVRTLGYDDSAPLLGLTPMDISPPVQADGEPTLGKAQRLLAIAEDKGFVCFEWAHLRADGSTFVAEVILSHLAVPGRRLILCIWSDLSARRKQEEQLGLLLEEQRLIFDQAGVGIVILRNREIIKCNAHLAQMFGYGGPAELEGSKTACLYQSEAQYEEIGRLAYSQLAERGHGTFEVEMRRRDGSPIWIIQSVRPLDSAHVLDAPTVWVFTDITWRKQADLILRQSEEKFSKAFESCPLAAAISSLDSGRFLEVNERFERNFGWPRAELLGRTSLELGFWPDEGARSRWLDVVRGRGRVVDHEAVWLTRDGAPCYVSLSTEVVTLNGQRCILSYVTDITARKMAEADLRIAAAAFESQEGMVITDASGVILRVNTAFVETTGYSAEEVVGQTPRILRSGRHDDAFYRRMWQIINETGSWQGEIWDRRKNGEVYPKWLTITAVKDEAGVVTHYIGTHFDITERKQSEERIRALAFYDQLTGLPNRTLLLDRLKQAQIASRRSNEYGALLFIDLDNFKTLNDTLGHDRGDQLLQQVALRLGQSVRQEDTVARLGGDEFVVVLASLAQDAGHAASIVEMIADKLLAALDAPYLLGDAVHRTTGSIGVTLFHGDALGIDDLMKQADLAMYKAKESGRNLVRFFDPTLESAVRVRAELEEDLRAAIELGQFRVYYQAQVAGEGHVTGAEALVRWQHPQRGMVSPAEFIPLAEETNLILPLGRFVLETACRQLVEWAAKPGFANLTLAVNVSARQLRQPGFVDEVCAVVRATGADPARLKLELTESLLVDNVQEIIAKMLALREIGIGFSLDDFGTGYSSLAYLKRLPLDQLKIDQSFVRDVLVDPSDATIARTIVALAHSLGLGVIAEGVETAEQLEFLRDAGCFAYQGYYFSRPLPVEDFVGFVRGRNQPAASPVPGA